MTYALYQHTSLALALEAAMAEEPGLEAAAKTALRTALAEVSGGDTSGPWHQMARTLLQHVDLAQAMDAELSSGVDSSAAVHVSGRLHAVNSVPVPGVDAGRSLLQVQCQDVKVKMPEEVIKLPTLVCISEDQAVGRRKHLRRRGKGT